MKDLASAAAVLITVVGTWPYLIATARGQLRPHAVSWFIWTITTFIAFVGQLLGGGGIGAAAAGASALTGVAVSGYAFRRGDRAYTCVDRACLAGALAALVGWAVVGNALAAIIVIALVDVIGAVPTIRKAIKRPDEEGISPFVLANAKWLLALSALDQLNALTLVFPATTSAVNTAIIGVVLIRRAQRRMLAIRASR